MHLREGLGPSPHFLTEAPLACELRGQGHSQGPIAALGRPVSAQMVSWLLVPAAVLALLVF